MMLNVRPFPRVPGFRVGLADDEEAPLQSRPDFSGAANPVTFGSHPYGNALLLTAPTAA